MVCSRHFCFLRVARAALLTGRLPIRNGFYTTNGHARNGTQCGTGGQGREGPRVGRGCLPLLSRVSWLLRASSVSTRLVPRLKGSMWVVACQLEQASTKNSAL